MPEQGLLLVLTDIPAELEPEFNRWYDEEHMRDLLAFPGVVSARRWRVVDGQPKYLAMYELEDQWVVEKPEYRLVSGWSPTANPLSVKMASAYFNIRRGVYRQLQTPPLPEAADMSGARGLLLRGLAVEPGREEEFDDWYNTEHLPALCQVPGVLRARRYTLNTEARDLKGEPPPYMAVYEMERPEVMKSEAWVRAVETPWTKRMRRFFRRPWVANVCERIFPA